MLGSTLSLARFARVSVWLSPQFLGHIQSVDVARAREINEGDGGVFTYDCLVSGWLDLP